MIKHAVIAGAGIGGLTAAIALAKKNIRVTVLEQAESLESGGAGVQLQPNATRVLYALGLESQLSKIGTSADGLEFRAARSGKIVTRMQSAAVDQFPHLTVHRADLLDCLLGCALSLGIELRPSQSVSSVEQDSAGVRVNTLAGAQFAANVLIGADGIHSAVRSNLFGTQAPVFTGNVAWRGLVPAAKLTRKIRAGVVLGPGRHFVMYPVRNGELINFVAQQDSANWQDESWTQQGDPNQLRAAYEGWDDDVTEILANTHEVYRWALFTRQPMAAWSQGRVCLMGDAAHPMLPNFAAGAAMAIEDGFILAECLQQLEPHQAFTEFYKLRYKRCTRAQKASAGNAKLFHTRSAFEQAVKLGAIRVGTRIFPSLLNRYTSWLRSYDATRVNVKL